MRTLRGPNGEPFFAIRVSPRQVMTFVPESDTAESTVYGHSLGVVSGQSFSLYSAEYVCGLFMELWGAR